MMMSLQCLCIKCQKDQLLLLHKTLTELLDNGFIQVSNSLVAAPIIFVKKPGGELRFCVDYRRLNEISRKDSYPIPRIDETLRTIAAAKYISKVDVISAFHRIRVKNGDKWKKAFNTRFGYMNGWLHLSDSPAHQQRFNDISIGFSATNSIFVVPRI